MCMLPNAEMLKFPHCVNRKQSGQPYVSFKTYFLVQISRSKGNKLEINCYTHNYIDFCGGGYFIHAGDVSVKFYIVCTHSFFGQI